jgi:hypothetical protein
MLPLMIRGSLVFSEELIRNDPEKIGPIPPLGKANEVYMYLHDNDLHRYMVS